MFPHLPDTFIRPLDLFLEELPRKKRRKLPPKHRSRETYRAIQTSKMMKREGIRATAAGLAVSCGFYLIIIVMFALYHGVPSSYVPRLAIWTLCGLSLLTSAISVMRKGGLAAPSLIVSTSLLAIFTGVILAVISLIGGLLELFVSWSEISSQRSVKVKRASANTGGGGG